VNAKDDAGNTPLIWAAMNNFGNPQVSQALIKAGADVNAKKDTGQTALDIARSNKAASLVSLLSKSAAQEN
jgi:ankyrin repeat protein